MTLTVDDRELIEKLSEFGARLPDETARGYIGTYTWLCERAANRLQFLLSERDKLEQRVRELEALLQNPQYCRVCGGPCLCKPSHAVSLRSTDNG